MNKRIIESAQHCVYEGYCPTCQFREYGRFDGCLVEFTSAIDDHFEQYRWHDLRKDPTDLPDTERIVDVMAKMLCKWDGIYRIFPMQMSYKAKIMYGKPIGWGIGYPYDFDFETDEVIAWREIEPFESDEK